MTYGSNLFSAYYNAQYALPVGYRRVEYLESSGTQWIDTGFVPTINFEIDAKFDFTYYNQICYLFGCCTTAWNRNVLAFSGNKDSVGGPLRVFLAGDTATGGNGGYVFISNLIQLSALAMNASNLSIDGVQYSYNNEYTHPFSLNITHSLYVFGRNNRGTADYLTQMKVHGFAIKDSNTLVRNFVPCVRIADSKAGLYDLCGSICPLTGTPFYINSGTGADLTWGELTV